MSMPTIIATGGLTLVFFIALFGGYGIGADSAERDNIADARIEHPEN